MSKADLTFAVVGTGNSGQTFAAHVALQGYPVRLAEVPAFEGALRAIERRGGIELSGHAGQGFARLQAITTDLGAAIKGARVIIIGGSAFAHEPLSRALAPHFEDGQFVWFTSNFGALRFRGWMRELGVTAEVTPVESLSLLYATRAPEPGRVVVTGVKRNLATAALPASRTREFLDLVQPVFPQLVAGDDVLMTSINNLNPIVHPPMVLCNAGRIEATGGAGWNLYADGATEAVTRLMLGMDAERLRLAERLGITGVPIKDAFRVLYEAYAIDRPTLSETLRQSPIHGDPVMPAPSSVDTRYIAEDLPFGLVPWASMGRAWGVATPTIDGVIQVAAAMLGRDYWSEGLTLRSLGLEGLSPGEARGLVR